MLTVMPFMSELRSFLITSELVWFLQQKIHPEAGAYSNIPEHLRLIGDCLWTLFLGTVGGTVAQFAASRPNRSADRS
jgi:hypothetical protein